MKKQLAFGVLLLSALFVTSCIKDDIEDCYRDMRIELRWIDTEPFKKDETVSIKVIPLSSDNAYEISSDVYGTDVNLMVRKYTFVGSEKSLNSHVDLNNRTVSIDTSTDGIVSEPDFFSAGTTTTEVTLSQGSTVIPLPMYRQVRPLVVEVHFTGGGAVWVEGIQGTLNGLAVERLIENGFAPVSKQNRPVAIKSGNIGYNFASSTGEGGGVWFAGIRRLLGIDGKANQLLNLSINYKDGPVPLGRADVAALSFDVTEQLAEFHTTHVEEPWYIVITIDMGIDLKATIVDWIAGPESIITAK